MRSRTFLSILILLATALFTPLAEGGDQPLVIVSIPPQKYLVEEIAGNLVQVEVLLPPGASPATYEPTPRQMANIDNAALYLQIGSPFEGPLLRKLSQLMPDLEIVDCRLGVELVSITGHSHDHGHGFLDPHIWLDPIRMQTIATTTAEALRALLPQASQEIAARHHRLNLALGALDREISTVLERFSGREILVFHPAYGYFTRRYALEQVAVEEDGKAPSARRLATIVQSVSDQSITAIFVQPQFSVATAQRVADALDCAVVELDPLAEDYPENLKTIAHRIAAALGDSS